MTSKDGNFAGSRDLQFRERQVPGTTSHIVTGKRALVSFLTMSANSVFPPHRHEAEQIMTVFDGYMDEINEGKLYRVKKGDVIVPPSTIEHGRYIREVDCAAIDIFIPPAGLTREALEGDGRGPGKEVTRRPEVRDAGEI